MPVCTTCTHATEYLYTTYESEYNLRLEQCRNCKSFVDPYVEFDVLTLFIDLILLKRGVYRHLLYNRGTPPRRVVDQVKGEEKGIWSEDPEAMRDKRRWVVLAEMGSGLVCLDAFIRWTYLNPTPPGNLRVWTPDMVRAFALVLAGTVAETLAFHFGVTLACYCVLKLVDMFRAWRTPTRPISAVRQQFRPSLIPLTMFYSSLTKYFLLLLLTVWMPVSRSRTILPGDALPEWVTSTLPNNQFMHGVVTVLDDDKLDREWVVRNVLGGMSAGFGLRVILDDIQPIFTTLIIVFGWAAKNFVAQVFSGWIGVDDALKQAWLAYSIP